MFLGRFRQSLENSRTAVAHLDQASGVSETTLAVVTRLNRGFAEMRFGYTKNAIKQLEAMLTGARRGAATPITN